MDCFDTFYQQHSSYLSTLRNERYSYLANEKVLFHKDVPRRVYLNRRCDSAQRSNPSPTSFLGILSFFNRNKRRLLVKCSNTREYSHCQEHYLFQVHRDKQLCSNFAPTPRIPSISPSYLVIHSFGFTGVTLVIACTSSHFQDGSN